MKHVVIFFTSWLLSQAAAAQDLIITREGGVIRTKIETIERSQVTFKYWDDLKGPTHQMLRNRIYVVHLEGGQQIFLSDLKPPKRNDIPFPEPAQAPTPTDPMLGPVPMKLSGPRLGVTLIENGALQRKLREDYSASPIISQFGWQFETRIFQLPTGFQGLFELVPLVGGLDQGLFLPSVSGVLGLRTGKGFEFGVGPNVSASGAALVASAGVNFQSEYVNLPVNVAVVPSPKGTRYTLTLGFNLRKR